MVVQSLKKLIKISEDSGDHNIIKYAIEQLGSCELERVKDFIEEISKIHGIAIKRSTLFLRDLFDVFKLEKKITKSSQKRKIFMYLQPIDRWVFNVSKQLEILEPTAELQDKYWEENASNIVDICLVGSKNEISPIKFNQGAWILGVFCGNVANVEKCLNHLDIIKKIMELEKGLSNLKHKLRNV